MIDLPSLLNLACSGLLFWAARTLYSIDKAVTVQAVKIGDHEERLDKLESLPCHLVGRK